MGSKDSKVPLAHGSRAGDAHGIGRPVVYGLLLSVVVSQNCYL
jgi:hypothetical protein